MVNRGSTVTLFKYLHKFAKQKTLVQYEMEKRKKMMLQNDKGTERYY